MDRGAWQAAVHRVQRVGHDWRDWTQAQHVPTELVMLPISSSAILFSFCLQSFLASGSFPTSWLLPSSAQSIGCSVSVNPSNEYWGLISIRIDGFISLQSKELSKVFSSTTVGKHQFFSAQPSLWPNSHMITGKTIALTIQNLFYTIHEFVLFNGLLSFAIIIYFDAHIAQKWARVPFTLISVSLIFYPWFPEHFITFWPKDISSSPCSSTFLAPLRKQPFSKKPCGSF